MNINDFMMQLAKFRMYQTQTVIAKNLNAVVATRCPVR
jgi:hypothetical protein